MSAPATQSERVFEALRRDILVGALHPGQRLPFGVSSKKYGASMGVLREALSRLVDKGLVVSEPGYGFRVVEISQDDLADLTEARCELETLAIRRAMTDGDLVWEASVVASYHMLARTPLHAEGDEAITPDWLAAHAAFHTILVAGCANRHLRELAAGLRDKAELYRNWCHPPAQDAGIALSEHAELLDAVLERDVDRGSRILFTHIGRTNRAIRNWAADADADAEVDVEVDVGDRAALA